MVLYTVDWIGCFREYRHEFRVHAIQKMIERDIGFDELDEATKDLQIIKEHADDTPYPSCLVLGSTKQSRPLHLVFALNHT